MIAKYQFVNGETNEINVSAELGAILEELDRVERLNDRRETRRHTSLGNSDEWGSRWIIDPNSIIEDNFIKQENTKALGNAINKLEPNQKDLVSRVFFDDVPQIEIAKELGVGKTAIANRLGRIYSRLKKNLE